MEWFITYVKVKWMTTADERLRREKLKYTVGLVGLTILRSDGQGWFFSLCIKALAQRPGEPTHSRHFKDTHH